MMTVLLAVLYWVFSHKLERSNFISLMGLITGMFVITYWLIRQWGDQFRLMMGLGLGFRLIFLLTLPNLSQDFYRFLWDGRLLVQGINPYLQTPTAYLEAGNMVVTQASELVAGMGELNAGHFSNYPPLNQLCFALAALLAGKSILGSAVVLRLLIILADIGILWFGSKLLSKIGLKKQVIFWFFLNPFVLIEITGNLHFESVMIFFMVWGLYMLSEKRWIWAAVLIGLSVSVKLIPLLFLPVFLRYFTKIPNWRPGFARFVLFSVLVMLTAGLTFAPFLSGDFLNNFGQTIALWFQNFEFNASIYYIIRWIGFQTIGWNIIADVGKILPLIVLAFVLIISLIRDQKNMRQLITSMLWCISFYFLLSTTVHPWYIATPLILGVFTPFRFPVIWSLLVMLSYSAYTANGFQENLELVALEYILGIVFVLMELNGKLPNPTISET
ncbi:polyprenol phosphomannose-dependent alpha 1,6 mannosyltransferase MptB [Aureitalea marina]